MKTVKENTIKILQKCFVQRDGKILILQRALNDTLPGKWDLPGGNLNFLENMEEGIIREIKEEAGIKVNKVERAGISDIVLNKKEKHFLLILYKAKIKNKKVVLSHEHRDSKWIKLEDFFREDINPLFLESRKEILKIIKSYSKGGKGNEK